MQSFGTTVLDCTSLQTVWKVQLDISLDSMKAQPDINLDNMEGTTRQQFRQD